MNERFVDAFEDCIKDMEKGSTINKCLSKYPNFSNELKPALEAAIAARSLAVSHVPSEIITRSRTQILGHAARLRTNKRLKFAFFRFPVRVVAGLLIALAFILGSRELIVVSAESLPGDSLYSIKRAVQNIRVQLAPNQETQFVIEAKYREQRIDEVLRLINNQWERDVSFEAIVMQMSPSEWIVGDITVILTDETDVIGDIRLDSLIEVEGTTTDEGTVIAHELHLREFKYIGLLESIAKDKWIITGEEFELAPGTQIDTSIQVGDRVMVLARTRDDRIHLALAILRISADINNPDLDVKDLSMLVSGKKAGDEFEISGPVDMISATSWVIDGYSISVTLLTEMDGVINLGDLASVHVRLGDDGSLYALEIEKVAGSLEDDQGEDSSDREGDGNEGSHDNDTDLDDGDESDSEGGSADDADDQTDDVQDDKSDDGSDDSGGDSDDIDDNSTVDDSSENSSDDSSGDSDDGSADDDINPDDDGGGDQSEDGSGNDGVEDPEEPEEPYEP